MGELACLFSSSEALPQETLSTSEEPTPDRADTKVLPPASSFMNGSGEHGLQPLRDSRLLRWAQVRIPR